MSKYLFECIDCKKHYVPDEVEYVCPSCAKDQKTMQPLRGLLRCIYDYERIAKEVDVGLLENDKCGGFGRYTPILPISSDDFLPPLITGMTPLRNAQRMAHELGLNEIWLKDDTCLPTGSFKDRASAMVVAMAREFGKDIIATASTGNAATALAGMATSAEMKSVIFVPESAPKAKLTQMAVYGARLVLVKGNYDQAFELSIEACKKFHWYNRNTAYNPYTVEGKKTAALEIWEQLEYSVPDWVIVPTGDGVILAGIEKGFYDLKQLGLSDRMPRLVCVQAEGASPIVDAVKAGNDVISSQLNPKTVADSISVGVPRAGNWVLKALKSTFGEALAVSDEEILSAISYLGKTTGIFAEPAAAAAIAGLKKMVSQNMIKNDERVVVLITGNGLKDVPAAMKSIEFPIPIEPSISFVRA